MWQRTANPSSNQLWYLGQDNVIYSKLNGFALKNVGNLICVAPYDPRSNQRWALQGNKIVNLAHPKRCVDISGANKSDGASLIAYDYKGSPNQHWQTDYI
nr:ricin lectin domain-containing protein 2 [Arenicola marina]